MTRPRPRLLSDPRVRPFLDAIARIVAQRILADLRAGRPSPKPDADCER